MKSTDTIATNLESIIAYMRGEGANSLATSLWLCLNCTLLIDVNVYSKILYYLWYHQRKVSAI